MLLEMRNGIRYLYGWMDGWMDEWWMNVSRLVECTMDECVYVANRAQRSTGHGYVGGTGLVRLSPAFQHAFSQRVGCTEAFELCKNWLRMHTHTQIYSVFAGETRAHRDEAGYQVCTPHTWPTIKLLAIVHMIMTRGSSARTQLREVLAYKVLLLRMYRVESATGTNVLGFGCSCGRR
jgi:hypothetical protein